MVVHELGKESPRHLVPASVYITVWIALLIFTGLTTGVAYIDLGVFNTVVALLIAGIKMMLVVLFFMHVKYISGMPRIVMIAAVFWLAIMMAFTLADEISRGWTPYGHAWTGAILPYLPHLAHFLR
ncbi:MAG TPA: cytochrome C oxidase subunit IV family protein [Candidatus Acidoferrales bacterium]|nr:cytochrome C oxidase subunit IV family protein [Candidatus Acidoferrales bacterium]